MGINLVSKCYCCEDLTQDTNTTPAARNICKYFSSFARIRIEGLQLQSIIGEWWSRTKTPKLQQIYNAIPALICWELRKRRNNRRHGGDVSIHAMIQHVHVNIHFLIRTLFPKMKVLELSWGEVIRALTDYKHRLFHLIVKWDFPYVGYQKCNTDGTSKGNPSPSTYGFCIKDHNGNLFYAQAGQLGQMTNIFRQRQRQYQRLLDIGRKRNKPLRSKKLIPLLQ